MLGVILDIILILLKIVGITLLAVIGLVLTLLLVILFVPVRYKSSGDFEKREDGMLFSVAANVSWLLHIVSVSVSVKDKENQVKLKLFGIDLTSKLTSQNDSYEREKKPKGHKKSKVVNKKETEKSEKPKKIEAPQVTEKKLEEKVITEQQKEAGSEVRHFENKVIEEKPKEKKSIVSKLKGIFDKISHICDKIRNVVDVKNSFIEYLRRPESKAAIKEIKNIVFKVLRHILPCKLKARIKFGFEEPATTGNVLGIASIFYGIYGSNLELEPDFDRQVLAGEYNLKGRIRVFTLLLAAWKLFRNRWIRDFISFSKKSVEGL